MRLNLRGVVQQKWCVLENLYIFAGKYPDQRRPIYDFWTPHFYTAYNFRSPPSLKPLENPDSQPTQAPRIQPKPPSSLEVKTARSDLPFDLENPDSQPTQAPSKQPKPPYKPPSSLEGVVTARSNLPFDFRFSYSESNSKIGPIGLREPKYSPFGPKRLDRVWTGVCALAIDPEVGSAESEKELEEKLRLLREKVQGEALTNAERKVLVVSAQRHKTKKQINLGRDGLVHNMLNDIHNHWQHAEAVRIRCLGVPTVDMKNVCNQLEDKTFGKIIFRHGGLLILYRGRNYHPKKRPKIPLMLWKPQEPVYPRLIQKTIDGLSIEETKQMRKQALSVPPLTKLAKNGYYGSLVPMVRDAFLTEELVRIDCQGLERTDYKKIGCKLRDLVPCIPVTFVKEQIVVWRGKEYTPIEGGFFHTERELFDDDLDLQSPDNKDGQVQMPPATVITGHEQPPVPPNKQPPPPQERSPCAPDLTESTTYKQRPEQHWKDKKEHEGELSNHRITKFLPESRRRSTAGNHGDNSPGKKEEGTKTTTKNRAKRRKESRIWRGAGGAGEEAKMRSAEVSKRWPLERKRRE